MPNNIHQFSELKFSLIDYWRMFKARGIWLPVNYFRHAHLFDLRYKTNTHTWLPKDNWEEKPDNFEHGFMYMCSWTNEIQNSFKIVKSLLATDFDDYSFVDIGCGKGKVVIVWKQECLREENQQAVYGIDFYQPLIAIAKKNYSKVFNEEGIFLLRDATQTEFNEFGKKVIVYLYNPFDEIILKQVMERLRDHPSIIIYNNPVHAQVVIDSGYKILYEHKGSHPNAETTILSNL
ncbi:methyltransferase domain-containing protein [Undibacterium sp. Rencai35W]|uniref:methyltransferase domain-containing protein n=1 Tax=Undibacterium sp. Rencai35W TaxID=3413046 RepID=UPI003BF1BF44